MDNITVRVSLDKQDMAFLNEIGLSVSDIVDSGIQRIKAERETEIPNETTLQAIEQSERDEGIYTARDEKDFLTKLGLNA